MTKKSLIIVCLIIVCLIIGGCGKAKVISLDKNIEMIEDNQIYFDCSQEMTATEKKSGTGNSIGYLCSLLINEDTKLMNINNQQLKLNDYSVGDPIRIYFSNKQNFTKKNSSFEAKEVILLD